MFLTFSGFEPSVLITNVLMKKKRVPYLLTRGVYSGPFQDFTKYLGAGGIGILLNTNAGSMIGRYVSTGIITVYFNNGYKLCIISKARESFVIAPK